MFVLFDLPAVTRPQKRDHAKFRGELLRLGFLRIQWSVYARAYARERASDPDRRAILRAVPPDGRVRCLSVTDLQFERMVCVDGRTRVAPEDPIRQLVLL